MDKLIFKQWRKQMGLTQSEAAAALGMGLSAIQQYEAGYRRDNKNMKVEIPLSIALACSAITAGLKPYGE